MKMNIKDSAGSTRIPKKTTTTQTEAGVTGGGWGVLTSLFLPCERRVLDLFTSQVYKAMNNLPLSPQPATQGPSFGN